MSISQIIAISFFCLLVIAFGRWLFPKKKKLQNVPFPEAWRLILAEKVAFYDNLAASDKARFEGSLLQFLSQVRITGVETTVDDTDKLLVASSSVIPLFGFPGWHFRKLNEVILYEAAFNIDYETQEGEERNILGMVGGTGMTGTMILSKPSLHQGFENRQSSQNVGIHEFVHLLDRADGDTDGIPEELLEKPFLIPWVKIMLREIKAIQDGDSDINPYGSTSEAEFLSVVSEYFFKKPHLLEKRHPELFAILERMYKQDLS
jgi:Mlc titration factor MtfA (ptsG expression regulator)